MFCGWRNGMLLIGHDMQRCGWSIVLCWNRREDLNDLPAEGEMIFADEKRLTWYPDKWLPELYLYKSNLYT